MSDETDDAPRRYDRVRRHPTPGPLNSLQHWTESRSPLRVALNYLLVWVARVSPSLRLKSWALRALGVDVGRGVSWALEATPDVFYPELITLEDHCIVGYDAVILCHEYLQEEYRTGEVVIGERAMVGAKATVLPGVHVGAGAQVAANSLVADDVPPGATVAGVPAEVVQGPDDEAGTDTAPGPDSGPDADEHAHADSGSNSGSDADADAHSGSNSGSGADAHSDADADPDPDDDE